MRVPAVRLLAVAAAETATIVRLLAVVPVVHHLVVSHPPVVHQLLVSHLVVHRRATTVRGVNVEPAASMTGFI